jgi:GNAT superfamily N-acetyltransferase
MKSPREALRALVVAARTRFYAFALLIGCRRDGAPPRFKARMTAPSYLADGYHPIAPGKLATLVTYLEMTARPDRPARPAPAGFTLEAVPVWPVDDYKALYKEIGWEWLWSSRLLMGDAVLAERLGRPTLLNYAPVTGGRRAGMLEMDWADPENVEITFFGLAPDIIGGGVGAWMMDRAIDLAFGAPATRRLWLHTCHLDSPQALPFYQRMGFSPYARAVEVFDDIRLTGGLDRSAGPHLPVIDAARRPDGL